MADHRGGEAYKRSLVRVFVERGLRAAAESGRSEG